MLIDLAFLIPVYSIRLNNMEKMKDFVFVGSGLIIQPNDDLSKYFS